MKNKNSNTYKCYNAKRAIPQRDTRNTACGTVCFDDAVYTLPNSKIHACTAYPNQTGTRKPALNKNT